MKSCCGEKLLGTEKDGSRENKDFQIEVGNQKVSKLRLVKFS